MQDETPQPLIALEALTPASFFGPGGAVKRALKNFEPRKQQERMAEAVYQAITARRHLIAEAGTGVGKSIAYLLPAALHAARDKKKVVVATHTKALQEQLVKHDLPVVQAMLEEYGLPLKYFLLMGSSNYLCLSRLERSGAHQSDLFDNDAELASAAELRAWAKTGASGCRSEIPLKVAQRVWEEVSRDPDTCLGRKCAHREACLYRRDIALAKQADVLVINQHLFFAGMPIPAFDAVIFDEAHNLEEVAAAFMGFAVTDRQVKRLMDDIYNPKSGRGLARRLKNPPAHWLADMRSAIGDVNFAARDFFHALTEKLGFAAFEGKQPAKAKRLLEPNIVPNPLAQPLMDLTVLLSQAIGYSQSDLEEAEIKSYLKRCMLLSEQLNVFLECKSAEHAYWAEISYSKRNPAISIHRAPVDVADELRKELFAEGYPVILTSATLAVDGSFEMIKARLGLDKPSELLLDSPFDYEKQAVVFIPQDIPDPVDYKAYEAAVIKQCAVLPAAVDGGLFFLFTSWQLLENSYRTLAGKLPGRPLFRQGEKLPAQLLADFKRAGNGILFATDTFWQGIDVPGQALACVVIARLPFLAPDTPLEEARQEWMAARGMNVFNEYSLPKAVVKFRQGFGRLIRSRTDFGAVVVLDPRIQTKRYGAKFLRSIPKCGRVHSQAELKSFFQAQIKK
ncbi:MAG TPA: helicase C-terminal domain-containing protein [Elusimicrobiales bacterium]|nr:helicase C-terminal domain-containing protein [Elusimicrobiales bacterium]